MQIPTIIVSTLPAFFPCRVCCSQFPRQTRTHFLPTWSASPSSLSVPVRSSPRLWPLSISLSPLRSWKGLFAYDFQTPFTVVPFPRCGAEEAFKLSRRRFASTFHPNPGLFFFLNESKICALYFFFLCSQPTLILEGFFFLRGISCRVTPAPLCPFNFCHLSPASRFSSEVNNKTLCSLSGLLDLHY